MTIVISLGGSIVAPKDGPNSVFLRKFKSTIVSWLNGHDRSIILVVGGGAPAREWQNAFREVIAQSSPSDKKGNNKAEINDSLDRIGIAATKLNAQLVKEIFGEHCREAVVSDPTADLVMTGKILVASGWKPGFSTDYDAVLLAERFHASKLINLSNISQIYTANPTEDQNATPLAHITFDALLKMIGTEWNPGANVPFDPVAAAKAKELGLHIVFARGTDLENLTRILENKSFIGTMID